MNDKIVKIRKKGEDGYKVISVRIKEGTLEQIDEIALKSNRSRNEIINIILENFAGNIVIDE
ncbi:MAG: ribbon-helix-helix protein, CopG family [Clostridia bacterium]|nr:ribbon-helix-helix protein, CopG family [Clostridia bacterium]MBQ6934295.1 ribbon-helix-helix protein, CopG family [Clostridia bacterium]MBQ7086843.1 ribbon-helix-helix protein, CopG family [Clostridia bacterium]MBQ7094558.1 ribbon-helix-helix protein, CopG family [Clostridia bacterium]